MKTSDWKVTNMHLDGATKEDIWESGTGWAEQTAWCYLQELSGTVTRALESMVPEH